MGDVPIFFARSHKTVVETNAQRIVAISGFPPTDHCEVLPWPSEAKDFNARMLTPPMICGNCGFEQRDPGGRAARWRFENRVRAAALSIET